MKDRYGDTAITIRKLRELLAQLPPEFVVRDWGADHLSFYPPGRASELPAGHIWYDDEEIEWTAYGRAKLHEGVKTE